MSASKPDRPHFFEGQTLGAADLTAAVDYARDLSRIAALGPHSWGVHVGCEVVAVAAGTGVQYFVTPGTATDLYGRTLVVAAPLEIPASRLSRLPSGVYPVWLRFDTAAWRAHRVTFEGCAEASEAYARLRESVAIEVGIKTLPKDRSTGIEVAGTVIEDPRLFLRALDETAPVVLDESVPHQFYPDDSAFALVPIGAVVWQKGTPGSFVAPDDDSVLLSRTLRRNAGVIAEEVLASDGVLRLMDRRAEPALGQSIDSLAESQRITPDDFDLKGARLAGKELVWIEGHTRARGDVRLWGTRLELRDDIGGEGSNAPLWLRRFKSTTNASKVDDLQIALSNEDDGKTRLTVGPIDSVTQDVAPVFVVDSLGRGGIGPDLPGNLDTTNFLVNSASDTSVVIASAKDKASRLIFSEQPPAGSDARITYEKSARKLHFGHGTKNENWATLSENGEFGLRTPVPENYAADANGLVVAAKDSGGITIKAGVSETATLAFATGHATAAERKVGWVSYANFANRLDLGTARQVRVSINADGKVGIGTTFPSEILHLVDAGTGNNLLLGGNSIRAIAGGVDTQLSLQPLGGTLRVHASLGESAQANIDTSGRLGLGIAAPAARLHIKADTPELRIETNPGVGSPRCALYADGTQRLAFSWERSEGRGYLWSQTTRAMTFNGADVGIGIGNTAPITRFHVAGSKAAGASNIVAHVALIENTSTSTDADVLALRIGTSAPTSGNNFITFFAGNTAIGCIEATDISGFGLPNISFNTAGADFAECLPRAAGASPIGAARIVGLKGGTVSLDTEGADAVFVTSEAPAVLGNWRKDLDAVEKIAMIGQVPLNVEGPLAAGDLVTPSGRADGTGRRFTPQAGVPLQIVGRALEAVPQGVSARIRVTVGLHAQDVASVFQSALAQQAEDLAALRQTVAALIAKLEG